MTNVVDLFRRTFGRAPQGVWSAPGRVNLIGEHTDYNNGLVLPIALPQRTYAACSPRTDDTVVVHSAQNGDTRTVRLGEVSPSHPGGWAAYVAGVLWALREEGHDIPGMDIVVDSDVPLGAGLSSSAALECAVAAAASDLAGLALMGSPIGRASLARICVRAENDIAGAPTGGMDQSASLLARGGHALLLDCRDGATADIPFDLSGEHVLLVTDTRAKHALNDGQYAARRAACEQAASLIGVASLRDVEPAFLPDLLDCLPEGELSSRTRHVITEIDRVRHAVAALRRGDLPELGNLFVLSHASLRDDYEVSCDELDVSVDAAMEAGALGARMTGGGFGGSSLALVPAARAQDVAYAIRSAFKDRGWTSPRTVEATAGSAARREQ